MTATADACRSTPHDLGMLIDELTALLQAGEPGAVEAFLVQHAEHAEALERLLPTLRLLAGVAKSVAPAAEMAEPVNDTPDELVGTLGDFRIIRQVGRGGMGVVYEAQQISLGRRVALKVLPFAAALDARHLQRFKNEAQAAAHLTHQNIVPVHFVGCDRGVHYYAMQYIDGQSLADIIDQLRRERDHVQDDPHATTADLPSPHPANQQPTLTEPAGTPAARTVPVAQAETVSATPGSGLSRSAYFAWVARLGEQAALALEHAHQQGVLHRDIKPANLLLDGRGNVWVTDFGLAHLPGDQRLTMTGDLLGTLRYMSPEQALAQRVTVDQRTDVYSLGVTLYELLTLQPAYRGKDRQELLRQIAFEEPKTPRRLDKAIPQELETIVLKAMAKAPDERYATARELADDLRHWLEDRPIRARRPPVWLRARRWVRRHRPLVGAAAAAALASLLVAAVGLGWMAHERATRQARAAKGIADALSESTQWQKKGRLPEALSAARRANGLLAGADVEPTLARQVRDRLADLDLVDRLQRIRLEQGTNVKGETLDWEALDSAYAQTFRAAGLDLDALPGDKAAARIRVTTVAAELASVLDHWARVRRRRVGKRDVGWKRLLRVAWLADPDAWRAPVRQALIAGDRLALRRLANTADISLLSPLTLDTIGAGMIADNDTATAEHFLRAAQLRYPDDLWLDFELAWLYSNEGQLLQPAEAAVFWRAAVCARPDAAVVRISLANELTNEGRLDEAIAECREALRIKKDFVEAHCNLGNALRAKGRLDEAIAEHRQAIRLKKDFALPHIDLGNSLGRQGRLNEAIAEYREAIRLDKSCVGAHYNLGVALTKQGRLDAAIAEYRDAIRLKKDYPEPHNALGNALSIKGRLNEAVGEYREAIRLKMGLADPHHNLGVLFQKMGRFEEAIREFREAIRLNKNFAEAHIALGSALCATGRLDDGIGEFRRAIRLRKDHTDAHKYLGRALREKGQVDEAIAECRTAIHLKQDDAEAHYYLGNAFEYKGRVDDAIAEYKDAIRLKKDDAYMHNDLGNALRAKGRVREAIAEFRAAIQLKASAEAHCNLANALTEQGLFREALAEFRRGHELGARRPGWPNPSAQWVRDAEARVRLDERLPEFLAGRAGPKTPAEQLELAWFCQQPCKGLYAASARWYADAFAREPNLADDLNAFRRYNAACAAVLAGCGKGKDAAKLSPAARARLRGQALVWLRADLSAWQQVDVWLGRGAAGEILPVVAHWFLDDDLAGIRGERALATLPERERGQWRTFWRDAETLRRRAAAQQANAPAASH